MRLLSLSGLVIVVTVILAACVSPAKPDSSQAPPPSPIETPQLPSRTTPVRPGLTAVPLSPLVPTEEVNVTTTLTIEPGMQALIDAATTDLAKRLSVTRDAIEVVSAQSVVWPDRSLGCPQPGMIYPQVLSEGFRIELRVKGQVYSYHGGEGRGPFLCEHPSN